MRFLSSLAVLVVRHRLVTEPAQGEIDPRSVEHALEARWRPLRPAYDYVVLDAFARKLLGPAFNEACQVDLARSDSGRLPVHRTDRVSNSQDVTRVKLAVDDGRGCPQQQLHALAKTLAQARPPGKTPPAGFADEPVSPFRPGREVALVIARQERELGSIHPPLHRCVEARDPPRCRHYRCRL